MDVAQQLQPVGGHDPREGLPVFEGQVVLNDILAGLVARDRFEHTALGIGETAPDMDLQRGRRLVPFAVSTAVLKCRRSCSIDTNV